MEKTLAYYVSQLRKDFSRYCEQELRQLTDGLFYFVIYLGKHPGSTPGEMACALRMDNGHTTRSVDRLEKLGYVSRVRSEADKRVFLLSLTPEGVDMFTRIEALLPAWDQAVCKNLSEGQRAQLNGLLQLVLQEAKGGAHVV